LEPPRLPPPHTHTQTNGVSERKERAQPKSTLPLQTPKKREKIKAKRKGKSHPQRRENNPNSMPLTKNSTNKLRREGEKLACFFLPPHKTHKNLVTELFFFFFFLFVTQEEERKSERDSYFHPESLRVTCSFKWHVKTKNCQPKIERFWISP
jgi:hypothetical protein